MTLTSSFAIAHLSGIGNVADLGVEGISPIRTIEFNETDSCGSNCHNNGLQRWRGRGSSRRAVVPLMDDLVM